MKYRQLGGEERSVLAALRLVGLKPAEIARELGEHEQQAAQLPLARRERTSSGQVSIWRFAYPPLFVV